MKENLMTSWRIFDTLACGPLLILERTGLLLRPETQTEHILI